MTDEGNKPTYDKFGINIEFNNPREKGIKEEQIQDANKYATYWYYDNGLNVIPCVSYKKTLYLMKYQKYYNEDMPEELFKHCLETGIFYYGIAAITGIIRRGKNQGKFFNAIDYDNLKGRNVLLTDSNGVVHTLDELAQTTIVETNHGSPDRGHVFYITERSLTPKPAEGNDDQPKLEIYSGNHIILVANSYKVEKFEAGAIHRTKFLKMNEKFTRLPIYLDAEQTEIFEKVIDEKLAKYGVPYLNKKKNSKSGKSDKTLDDMLAEDYKIYSGGNRQGALLSYTEKLILHLKNKHILSSLENLKNMAMEWNNKHCIPPVEQWEFDIKLREAVKFVESKTGFVEGEEELIKELEELGVQIEQFMDEKTLFAATSELSRLISSHLLKHETPRDPIVAADVILEKYKNLLKTLDDTDEMIFFNGKVYEIYGDKVVKKELERMRKEESFVLTRLSELATELTNMIIRRNNAGKNSTELANYEYALTEKIYKNKLSQMKVTEHFRNEVVHNIIVQTWIKRDLFTTGPSVIVLENGVLELTFKPQVNGTEDLSWELVKHSPDILSTNLLNINYDPNADCPKFKQFLDDITGVNKKTRIDIQKMMGYCLLKSNKYKKAFMLKGDGDNGKSIILYVIEQLVGSENVSNLTLQDICNGNQFSCAPLYGKMVNTCGDLDMEKLKSTSRFKMIVAGDRFSIEQKNKGQISFLPTVKLVFATNEIPDTDDDGYGYFVRWVLIPLDITIPFEDQDKDLKFKLTTPEELSGILNFALEGLKMLLADGGFENIGSINDVKKMYKESANVVEAFLDRCYDVVISDKSSAVPRYEVQKNFINYLRANCSKEQISRYLNMKFFGEILGEDKVTKHRNTEDLDLDNELIRSLACQVLGRELSKKGISESKPRNEDTKKQERHYVGLRRKYKIKELDSFLLTVK